MSALNPSAPLDTADYGRPNDEDADPSETHCKACGHVATDHSAGRFSIYGLCPVAVPICAECGERKYPHPDFGGFCSAACFDSWWTYLTDMAQYEQDRSDHDMASL